MCVLFYHDVVGVLTTVNKCQHCIFLNPIQHGCHFFGSTTSSPLHSLEGCTAWTPASALPVVARSTWGMDWDEFNVPQKVSDSSNGRKHPWFVVHYYQQMCCVSLRTWVNCAEMVQLNLNIQIKKIKKERFRHLKSSSHWFTSLQNILLIGIKNLRTARAPVECHNYWGTTPLSDGAWWWLYHIWPNNFPTP